MIKPDLRALSLGVLCAMTSFAGYADDVRSIAMGGAAVTAGTGVAGALNNPSLLMQAQRQEERYQFHFGMYGQIRDQVDIVDEVDKNENTIDDIDREIDNIADQTITCVTPTATRDDVCLTGTSALGNLADGLLETFENINGEPVEGRFGADIGISVVHTPIPFTISIGTRVTGTGQADISEEDIVYTTDLADVLGDDDITLGEIEDTPSIALTNNNGTIQIEQPDDILTSEASGSAVIRTQFTVAFAKSFDLNGDTLDMGVAPKLSTLRAGDFTRPVEELDDDDVDIVDDFEDSENEETSFTFDVGASMMLPSAENVRLGGVVRNVIPESVESGNGFEFETTPQAVVSGLYEGGWYRFTGDLALNKAKQDNFETQELNLGTELTKSFFSFRAGMGHDLALDDDATTFSVGVGLGVVDFGLKLSGQNVTGGLQVAFSL